VSNTSLLSGAFRGEDVPFCFECCCGNVMGIGRSRWIFLLTIVVCCADQVRESIDGFANLFAGDI
jgi:hypothetical protein